LRFASGNYVPGEVKLTVNSEKVSTSFYSRSAEWTYSDSLVQVYSTRYYDLLIVNIGFQRQANFLIINVLLPILMMAVMNILVFVIPPESGERISYAITALLAVAVYLTIVGENLPKSSSPMPIFCFYLTTVVALNVSMCFLTVVNLRIYHKDVGSIPPTWCRRLVQIIYCSRSRYRRSSTNQAISRSSSDTLDSIAELQKVHEDTHNVKVSWKDVSYVVDVVLVVFYVLVSVIVNVCFILILQSSQPHENDYTFWF